MNGGRARVLAVASAVAILGVGVAVTGVAAASQWWPASTAIGSAGGSIGLAANLEGGFLLVSSGGGGEVIAQAGYCAPGGTWSARSYPRPLVYEENFGSDLPGSPVFAPDGTATVLGLEESGFIGKPVVPSEGA